MVQGCIRQGGGAVGSGTRPCRVLTVLGGVICGVTTEALLVCRWDTGLRSLGPTGMPPLPTGLCACPSVCLSGLSGQEPLPRVSWEPGRSGEWEGCALKSLWLEQAVILPSSS